MDNKRIASFLIRIGLAFIFLYVAVDSFRDPFSWIGFFPTWTRSLLEPKILLTTFSVYEIIIGAWLLSGFRIFYAGIFSSLTLFAVIILNIGAFNIVFRDIALLFSAIALIFLHKKGA